MAGAMTNRLCRRWRKQPRRLANVDARKPPSPGGFFHWREPMSGGGSHEQSRRSRTCRSENECCQRGALVVRRGKKAARSQRSPPPGGPTEEGRAGFHEGDFGTRSLGL